VVSWFEFDFGAEAWGSGVQVAFEVEGVGVLPDPIGEPAEVGWFFDAVGVAGKFLFALEVGFA
jgi:hypothetical protein